MIEFVKEIQRSFETEEQIKRDDDWFTSRPIISFEIFHRVAAKAGLSIGLRHSRIIWVLMNAGHEQFSQRFTLAEDAFEFLIRFYLQPSNSIGRMITKYSK